MKKQVIIGVVSFAVLIILAIFFLSDFIYFKNFNRNIRELTEEEKETSMEIISQTMNIEGYQTENGRIYAFGNKKLVSIEISRNEEKKIFLINLEERKIIQQR